MKKEDKTAVTDAEDVTSAEDISFSAEVEPQPLPEEVTWTASEFIAHDKSAGWYVGLAFFAALLSGLMFLITRDYISVAVVIVGALVLGYYASHQPRQLEYRLDQRGIDIGPKHYDYEEFKSFSIVPEGAFSSIALLPLKRFAPMTTIYYPPEYEERIVAVLGSQLPLEEPRRDAIDNLMRRIRF